MLLKLKIRSSWSRCLIEYNFIIHVLNENKSSTMKTYGMSLSLLGKGDGGDNYGDPSSNKGRNSELLNICPSEETSVGADFQPSELKIYISQFIFRN